MKYSVIIPCYKCETTLEKTVSSIQACGLTDFEIILVDDGSPDTTPALCDRLAAEQGNVRVFHQPNGGVSSARNHGLAEAQGDYVWFFDSDDLVDPGSMTRAVQIIEEYTPDMLIFGMSFDFYRNGERYKRWDYSYQEEALYSLQKLDAVFDSLYSKNAFSSSCNKLFHKHIITDNHIIFSEKLHAMEDFHFVMQILSCCKTIYVWPEIVYRYLHFAKKKKNALDPSVERALRIRNLADYMDYFEPLLLNHKNILVQIYFVFLRQKLGAQNYSEMKDTANNFKMSRFSKSEYLSYCSPSDRMLAKQLIKGNISYIRARKKLGNIKRKTVRKLKRLKTIFTTIFTC